MASAMMQGTLRTFVGTEESAISRYMEEAEGLLKKGDYYSAANAYGMAQVVDARNPLPSLGRSLALLAAGDYLTSANDLFRAIRLAPPDTYFKLDLEAFVPNLEILDRRRADLENRLERTEDFRLRFLLGFAEFCSDLHDLGLKDMKTAAQAMPEEMAKVREFVQGLERHEKGLLSPIEVPSSTQPSGESVP